MTEDISENREGIPEIRAFGEGEGEEGNLVCSIPPRSSKTPLRNKTSLSMHINEGFFLEKPPLSYIALIAKAILSSPANKLNLAAIYKYIEDNFPFYRSKGRGWRNSVRHNLSLNDCFIKVGRCEDGKGNYWSIHPSNLAAFVHGDFRQHRKSRKRGRQKELDTCFAMNYYMPWEHYPFSSVPNSLYQAHYLLDPLWRMLYADRLHFVNEYQKWNVNYDLVMEKFALLLPLDEAQSIPVDWLYRSPATSAMQQNIFLSIQQTFPNSLVFSEAAANFLNRYICKYYKGHLLHLKSYNFMGSAV